MLLLLQNPDVMQRVLADPSLVPAALEESLRYESPTQWISRLRHPGHRDRRRRRSRRARSSSSSSARRTTTSRCGTTRTDSSSAGPTSSSTTWASAAASTSASARRSRGSRRGSGLTIALERLRNLRLAPGKNDLANIQNIQKRVPAGAPSRVRPGALMRVAIVGLGHDRRACGRGLARARRRLRRSSVTTRAGRVRAGGRRGRCRPASVAEAAAGADVVLVAVFDDGRFATHSPGPRGSSRRPASGRRRHPQHGHGGDDRLGRRRGGASRRRARRLRRQRRQRRSSAARSSR